MNRIKEVNFGFSDAITEAERNPKNFDLSFFDPHDYLKELINGIRFIICGKKGDGKSAFGAKICWVWHRHRNHSYVRGNSVLLSF